MHTLYALLLTAAAVVVVAHPGSIATSNDDPANHKPNSKYLGDHQIPKNIWPHYLSFEEGSDKPVLKHLKLDMPVAEWLAQEIERLNRLRGRAEPLIPLTPRFPDDTSSYMDTESKPYDLRDYIQPINKELWPSSNSAPEKSEPEINRETIDNPVNIDKKKDAMKTLFALTPKDKGYFDTTETEKSTVDAALNGLHEGGKRAMQTPELPRRPELQPEPPRQPRQNPNLGRTKTLLAENLDKLRMGLSNKEYRLPVSLLPSNLRWLKISRPIEVNQSKNDETDILDTFRQMATLDNTNADSAKNFYGVALISGIGAIAVLAIAGFGFGWYTLSKRAKAAADVEYPAYGVTGPTVDTSGDRKLAHSAHMYHYQHQKQQIIAMERNGMEQRSGSVSDPESDEENEEGDYTVYECPGFATTGDMEVKNPLFNEEPTPATPANCELVKPQPKE